MKINIFKKESGEVAYKIEGDEAEYSFNETGVFRYIDLIIKNNYCSVPISYDEKVPELKSYSELLREIFNEITNPDNKFKETYDKYVVNEQISNETNSEMDRLFGDRGDEHKQS